MSTSADGEHALATATALEQLANGMPANSSTAATSSGQSHGANASSSPEAPSHETSLPLHGRLANGAAHELGHDDGAITSAAWQELLMKAPRALESLPHIHLQTQRLIELLMDQSQAAGRLSQHTTNELRRLADTMNLQSELLTALQSQLQQRSNDSAHIQASLDAFRATVGDLAESSLRAANILADMSRVSEHREERLMKMLAHTRRWFIIAAVLSALACVGAVLTVSRGVWW